MSNDLQMILYPCDVCGNLAEFPPGGVLEDWMFPVFLCKTCRKPVEEPTTRAAYCTSCGNLIALWSLPDKPQENYKDRFMFNDGCQNCMQPDLVPTHYLTYSTARSIALADKKLNSPHPPPNQALVRADDLIALGNIMVNSGAFKGMKNPALACVKIEAGRAYGLQPVQSMQAFHVFEGQITAHYSFVGALIRRSGTYDYEIVESTDTACTIKFYRVVNGKQVDIKGVNSTTWTIEKAKQAGLLSKNNWKNYPSAMLFGRALTEGARQITPDVFYMPIYSPEEMGVETDAEGRPLQPDWEVVASAVEPPERPSAFGQLMHKLAAEVSDTVWAGLTAQANSSSVSDHTLAATLVKLANQYLDQSYIIPELIIQLAKEANTDED